MTGRDLIIYILRNNLENEEVVKDGTFIGFMDEKEAASKFEVGISTVRTWSDLGVIEGYRIGGTIFFFRDTSDPRKGVR